MLEAVRKYYTGTRITNDLFGPRARPVRLAIVRAAGLTTKDAQWGNFRRALIAGLGIDATGKCIAEVDNEIDAACSPIAAAV